MSICMLEIYECKCDPDEIERCGDGNLHDWSNAGRDTAGYVITCTKCNEKRVVGCHG